jgi:hypothetical protein
MQTHMPQTRKQIVSSHEPVDPSEEPNAPDQARQPRTRVLKGAHAAFNQEFSAIPCTLRDISTTGAHIVFEGGWFVPDRFMLHVDIDGYKIECERVWQRGSECGVRFIGEKLVTGKARQQVLTPEPYSDDAVPALGGPLPRPIFGDTAGPRPLQRPRPGGFGRRTR